MSEFEEFSAKAEVFAAKLAELKSDPSSDIPWYPYGTMNNTAHLRALVDSSHDWMFRPGVRCADFGAADGDWSFFLESLGQVSDIYDFGPTNMNGLRGARELKYLLKSNVQIFETDLDSQWKVSRSYDIVYFLGLLYHLKNPFYALETLSHATRFAFVSTRVARRFDPSGPDVSGYASAYLLDAIEANNDATNYWIFTRAGLLRLCDRCGWRVLSTAYVGDIQDSNPRENAHDERAFLLIQSRRT